MPLDTDTATAATLDKPFNGKLLIGGKWIPAASGETLSVEDPATGQVIGQIAAGSAIDVDKAVRAARAAFDARTWRGLPAARRAAIMWKIAELMEANETELARTEVFDNGMTMDLARRLVTGGAGSFRHAAGLIAELHGRAQPMGGEFEFHAYTILEPVGVVGLITPWNGPLASASNKMAAALAAGCSLICKPSEMTSLTALRLAELAMEAGVPEGVVNVVTGRGPEVGAALVNHPDVNKINFTGSTAVGKQIIVGAAGNLKRVNLELGGKSAVFVFDDADLETTIPAVAMGIFGNSGQMCFAGSRLYAQPGIYDALIAGLADFAQKIVLGNGFDPATQLGPLISSRQRERVLGYVDSGCRDGAEVVVGGSAPDREGWFMKPTILANTTHDMAAVREEIFGPVLCAMQFNGLEDVARLGNATDYGLAGGVYTRDISKAHTVAKLLDTGNVWVNCYARHDVTMPFGGVKQSGWGRGHGSYAVNSFLEEKSVIVKL